MEKGEKRIFGTYYSERGPIKIPLEEYIWLGDKLGWAQVGSPAAKQFEADATSHPNGERGNG